LASRETYRLFEGVLALFKPVESAQCDTFQAMKFRLPLAMACLLCGTQPISRRCNSLSVLPLACRGIGQQGQAVASQAHRASWAGKPLAQTRNHLIERSLERQGGTA
jgi:hypothetical protein